MHEDRYWVLLIQPQVPLLLIWLLALFLAGPAHDVKLALTAGARHLVIYEWVVFILGWQ